MAVDFWPNLKNGQHDNVSPGAPVKSVKVIRQNSTDEFQVTSVAKESADGVLTRVKSLTKMFLYSGGVYTEYTDADSISLLSDPTDMVVVMCDRIMPSLYFDIKDAGSYTGLLCEIWDGDDRAPCPTGESDGTGGWTVPGRWLLGAVTESVWKKTVINGVSGYPVFFTCTGVTAQATTQTGGLYWDIVYQFPKSCLFKTDTLLAFSEKDNGEPAGYNSILSTPFSTYGNLGIVTFDTNPLNDMDNYFLVADYYYKNPQPGEYVITFPDDIQHCKVNDGSSIAIIADGAIKHYNIIPGCEVIFYSTLQVGDSCTVRIAESLQYADFSTDGTTYGDRAVIGNMSTGQALAFYVRQMPPMAATGTYNSRNMSPYAYGEPV